jgi:hypothetical protein
MEREEGSAKSRESGAKREEARSEVTDQKQKTEDRGHIVRRLRLGRDDISR